jgi:hypothetical protein
MRIIVDIEGDNVNVTTEPAHKTSVNVGSGVPVAAARRTPPPELLKAAAALGAHDAGPAPEHIAGSVKSGSAREWRVITGPSDAGAARARGGGKTEIKKTAAKPGKHKKRRS